MPFEGYEKWNSSRYVNRDDEEYLQCLTEKTLEEDVRREVKEVIDGLQSQRMRTQQQ